MTKKGKHPSINSTLKDNSMNILLILCDNSYSTVIKFHLYVALSSVCIARFQIFRLLK